MRVAASIAALLLALLPFGGSAADPIPLQAEQSGRLAGNSGGAFTSYRFFYAGQDAVGFSLRVRQPNASAVGLRLYGPRGEVGDLTPRERGEHTIQVYNYDAKLIADYTLIATGLPVGTPPAGPTPTATATPGDAGEAEPLKGALPAGGAQGAFALFEFDHPGDGSAYRVALQLAPERRAVLDRAGFKLYDANGQLQLTGGAQPGLKPNVVGDFTTRVAGTYTVQLYNYGEVPVEYEVSLQPD